MGVGEFLDIIKANKYSKITGKDVSRVYKNRKHSMMAGEDVDIN
jgi:hypothetical protein